MQVTDTPIAELVAYEGNAKEHPDWQVAQIAESIRQFGFADPVGVWHDAQGRAVIVEGHGRVMAAKSLGMETVPTISLDHMTDEERRAYGIAHNSTNMGTGFDADVLKAELDAITDIDMSDFGFDEAGNDATDLYDEPETRPLAEIFGFVPFSVVQSTTGDWLYRKAAWLGLGIRSELGRDRNLIAGSDSARYF